jgi:hypothetical protein
MVVGFAPAVLRVDREDRALRTFIRTLVPLGMSKKRRAMPCMQILVPESRATGVALAADRFALAP